MNENVRKIFDMLGVEPGEEFEIMLKDNSKFSYKFKFDENLQGYCFRDKWRLETDLLMALLSRTYTIIKIPKKKKLRDLTPEEWDKWKIKKCNAGLGCDDCIFDNVCCSDTRGWIYHKDLYSDKFLDQEIEVKE